jgi:hypothetical protein
MWEKRMDVFSKQYVKAQPEANSPTKPRVQEGLIYHPLLDWLGHTTNSLVIALFLTRGGPFTKKEVEALIENHKSAMREVEHPITSRGKKIDHPRVRVVKDGKESINFWLEELARLGALTKKTSNPVKYHLVVNHEVVQLFKSSSSRMNSQTTPAMRTKQPPRNTHPVAGA